MGKTDDGKETRKKFMVCRQICPFFAPHEAPHAWTNGFKEGWSRLGADHEADTVCICDEFPVSLAFNYELIHGVQNGVSIV